MAFGSGVKMEKVEGLMKNLKLSAAEQKGFGKNMMLSGSELVKKEAQELGKIFSEKPIHAEGIAASLGRVWCPLKGVRCKALSGNVFLFTFLHESGKRKALFDGPWQSLIRIKHWRSMFLIQFRFGFGSLTYP
jgi:hypothetical protein